MERREALDYRQTFPPNHEPVEEAQSPGHPDERKRLRLEARATRWWAAYARTAVSNR